MWGHVSGEEKGGYGDLLVVRRREGMGTWCGRREGCGDMLVGRRREGYGDMLVGRRREG